MNGSGSIESRSARLGATLKSQEAEVVMVALAGKSTASSRTHRLQNELSSVDRHLDELQSEQQALEELVWRLECRRSKLEDEHTALLDRRDRIEDELWDAQRTPISLAPTPPDVSTWKPRPRLVDPALEPWDVESGDAPAPEWLPPAHTWRVPVAVPAGTAVQPRRGVKPEAATPTAWAPRSNTAPIWRAR